MSKPRDGEMTLSNLLGGDIEAEFLEELRLAAENVLDPNTVPTAARKVKVEVALLPNEARDMCRVVVEVTRKDGKLRPRTSIAFVGRQGGRAMFSEKDSRQNDLFDDKPTEVANLVVAGTAGEGE